MVRLFTKREVAEHCKDYKPIPLFLQKAILNTPTSIRNNPYTDTHRYTEPNYQAPMNPLTMALNAQNLYGVPINNYLEIYNELMEKEIKTNRARLDRNLEATPSSSRGGLDPDDLTPSFNMLFGNDDVGIKTQFRQPSRGMDQRVIEEMYARYQKSMENDLGVGDDELAEPKPSGGLRGHSAQETLPDMAGRLNKEIFARPYISATTYKDQGTQLKPQKAPVGRPPEGTVWSSLEGEFVMREDRAVGVVTEIQPAVLGDIVETVGADSVVYDVDVNGDPL
tara:strand:- start:1947 stop:2786 length:840 start_codon:yes stop_codon:yes gene_type:complete